MPDLGGGGAGLAGPPPPPQAARGGGSGARGGVLRGPRRGGRGAGGGGGPAVWVGFGALADPLAAADHVVGRDVQQAPAQVDVADLQGAQLAAPHTGDRYEPQVQAEGLINRPGRGDHLRDILWRGG